MKDFEGKRIKLVLNATSGWIEVTGKYVKAENGFLAIYNSMIKKIQYFTTSSIKSIEIVGEASEGE